MIKLVHDLVNFYSGKFNTGYFTDEEIDNALHVESLNLFKKYFKVYEATQEISDYLRPFLKESTIGLTSGKGDIPNDYEHPVMILTIEQVDEQENIVVKPNKTIEQIARASWGYRVDDKFFGPTEDHPICRIDSATFEVRPTTITKVFLQYLKTPVAPLFKRTPEGDFDPDASIDLEWSAIAQDEIINRTLVNLGISMREGELIEYSQIEKQQERS